jgi:isoleucyl-tRNA synthetase
MGHILSADEVLVERLQTTGWAVAAEDGVTVAFDTTLDDDLRLQARVYELIHQVNAMRRTADLDIIDRITLTLPVEDEDLLEHRDWIAAETLATSIIVGDSLSLVRAKKRPTPRKTPKPAKATKAPRATNP